MFYVLAVGTKKRSILVDCKGVPLGVVVGGANKHDMKLTEAALQNLVIDKPEPTTIKSKQHICHDRGCYTIHIRLPRKETSSNSRKIPGYRAKHWVVERTHSWMNRFRRLLIC